MLLFASAHGVAKRPDCEAGRRGQAQQSLRGDVISAKVTRFAMTQSIHNTPSRSLALSQRIALRQAGAQTYKGDKVVCSGHQSFVVEHFHPSQVSPPPCSSSPPLSLSKHFDPSTGVFGPSTCLLMTCCVVLPGDAMYMCTDMPVRARRTLYTFTVRDDRAL